MNIQYDDNFLSDDQINQPTIRHRPVDTLKKRSHAHARMELTKADLLRLLSCLEGELEAREIALAAQKAEKAKQLLYQAKYGKFGASDPFAALQRDSESLHDDGFTEASVRNMYDDQLQQLEQLISSQRTAQNRMREQLVVLEKRYQKVHSELDEERTKHARDTAEGDDVTMVLTKERERLAQQLDFERSHSKKLDKDLRRLRATASKHKQVAISLIKERRRLAETLLNERSKLSRMESVLKSKLQNMAEGFEGKVRNDMVLEEQVVELEASKSLLTTNLAAEQQRCREVEAKLEAMTLQCDRLQTQLKTSTGGAGSSSSSRASPLSSAAFAPSPSTPGGGSSAHPPSEMTGSVDALFENGCDVSSVNPNATANALSRLPTTPTSGEPSAPISFPGVTSSASSQRSGPSLISAAPPVPATISATATTYADRSQTVSSGKNAIPTGGSQAPTPPPPFNPTTTQPTAHHAPTTSDHYISRSHSATSDHSKVNNGYSYNSTGLTKPYAPSAAKSVDVVHGHVVVGGLTDGPTAVPVTHHVPSRSASEQGRSYDTHHYDVPHTALSSVSPASAFVSEYSTPAASSSRQFSSQASAPATYPGSPQVQHHLQHQGGGGVPSAASGPISHSSHQSTPFAQNYRVPAQAAPSQRQQVDQYQGLDERYRQTSSTDPYSSAVEAFGRPMDRGEVVHGGQHPTDYVDYRTGAQAHAFAGPSSGMSVYGVESTRIYSATTPGGGKITVNSVGASSIASPPPPGLAPQQLQSGMSKKPAAPPVPARGSSISSASTPSGPIPVPGPPPGSSRAFGVMGSPGRGQTATSPASQRPPSVIGGGAAALPGGGGGVMVVATAGAMGKRAVEIASQSSSGASTPNSSARATPLHLLGAASDSSRGSTPDSLSSGGTNSTGSSNISDLLSSRGSTPDSVAVRAGVMQPPFSNADLLRMKMLTENSRTPSPHVMGGGGSVAQAKKNLGAAQGEAGKTTQV